MKKRHINQRFLIDVLVPQCVVKTQYFTLGVFVIFVLFNVSSIYCFKIKCVMIKTNIKKYGHIL